MPTDHFADDPRTNLERMLAGDLYIADDPEIARRQQRAVRLAVRYQAAYAEDADGARPVLAELLGALGEEAHVRPPLYVTTGATSRSARAPSSTTTSPRSTSRPSSSARTARSARTSNCSPPPIRWHPGPAATSSKRHDPSPSGTTCGSGAAPSCCRV
ncbi:hypothetical protein ACE1SV_03710 [Streptomyces sennicomposti]